MSNLPRICTANCSRVHFSRSLRRAGLSLTLGLTGLASESFAQSESVAAEPLTPSPALQAPAADNGASSAGATVAADSEVYMLDDLVVQSDLVKNSVVTVRQQADVAVDMLSASDFGKFIGTDVADIVVRVPGLSTTSKGSFAVVRGLAERYNPVMLDGIVLPSSDPERQSPQLDIFPGKLVDAIVITKAYDPRLPGTASGAGIDLRTRPMPEGKKTEVQFGVRADEGLLKNESVLGAKTGGPLDHFGLGVDERRPYPGPTNPGVADPALLAYVKSPGTTNGLRREDFPIGGRFAFSHEDLKVIDETSGRKLGYSVSYSQDRSASSETGFRQSVGDATQGAFADGTANRVIKAEISDYEEFELENRWGLLGSVGFAANERHLFRASAFWSQIGLERYARDYNGLSGNTWQEVQTARSEVNAGQPLRPELNVAGLNGQDEIYYSQRHLFDFSVGGEHDFTADLDTNLTWTLARLQARQQEPEYLISPFRSSSNNFGQALNNIVADFGGSQGLAPYTRYWRDTVEDTLAGRIDLETAADAVREHSRLRYGYYFDRTSRDYREDSFSLQGGGVNGFSYDHFLYELANQPSPPAGYGILSFGSPSAEAERHLDAVYLSGTFSLLKDKPRAKALDLMVGARVEDFGLVTTGQGRVGNVGSRDFYAELARARTGVLPNVAALPTTFTSEIDETDYLPAAALTYTPRESLNVRLAYSETTARPSFREVGSYFTIDRIADEYVHGNDGLTVSEVRSYDFRIEYFSPSSTDTFAISLFRKDISNPIERVSIFSTTLQSISTFVNNENDAAIDGLELEAAKNLGFLGEWADSLTFGGNYTFLDAAVARDSRYERRQLNPAQDGGSVPDERPLYDQPEWIANAYLTWDVRPVDLSVTLSYFQISDTLLKVNELTWDTYTEGYSRWDLTLSKRLSERWRVNASVRNLFDPERRLVADPDATRDTIVYRSFHDGRSYSITATCVF